MPVNSNSAGRISLATSLAGDFTMAMWARFGSTSGLPVLLAFDGAHYTYIDGGDLYLQFADAGAWDTNHHWLVWRRIGGTMSLYGCQQGAAALTFLAEDEFFGTSTVSQIDLLGDAVFGASENITASHLLVWSAAKSDAILLKERWNWHPQETDDLEHFVRMSTPGTAGTAEVGANPTVTGTLASAPPKWLVVGDSIASGRLDISDPIDPDSLAGSSGAGSITELSSLGFVIDGTQAIPGEPMADHVTAMASRLIPSLVATGPGSFVPIFGSINDVFRGDSEDCYGAIVSLATAVRNHGCYPIGIGPTDSSWDSPPTFVSADIRAMVMADTANFVDRWDVGADGGHYSLTGGDGLHPVSYSGLNTFFKARLTSYLLGAGAETIDPSGIASSEAFGEASVSLETVTVAPSAIPSGEAFGSASIGMQVVASGIASSEAFGDHTVSPGAISIGASSIASAEALGSPAISYSVLPESVASSEAFGDPALSAGEVTIAPSGIGSAGAFGDAVVSAGESVLAPSGIASEEAFGGPTLSLGAVSLSPSGIASGENFGDPAVDPGAVGVSPSSITSTEALGSPVVSAGDSVVALQGIASAEAFGATTVSPGPVSVSPSGIASSEAFGEAAVVAGALTVSPESIPSEEAFGAASLSVGPVSIVSTSIASEESFGTPVLGAGSSIVQPAGIASSAAFGVPSLGVGPVALSPSSIASQEAFGSARLGQVVGAQSIASDEMLGTPALSMGAVSVGPLGISSAESLGLPRVALELQFLSPQPIASGEAFGLPLVSSFEIDHITPIVSGPHIPGGLRVSHRTTQ